MSEDDLQDCDQVKNKTLEFKKSLREHCTFLERLRVQILMIFTQFPKSLIYTAKLCPNRLKY